MHHICNSTIRPTVASIPYLHTKYNIIIILLYFYLFGGILLKICHVPGGITPIILTIMDMLPFMLYPIFNAKLKTSGCFIDSKNFWITIIIIIGLLALADIRHGVSMLVSITHIGALIRFIPLAIIFLTISKHDIVRKKFHKTIRNITIIILCLSWVSIILGQNADILFPNLPENNTAERELLQGWHSAIYANTIDLAFLLLILYVFWINHCNKSPKYYLGLFVIFFVPVYLTGSVISALLFLSISLYQCIRNKRKIKVIFFCMTFVVISILCWIYWDLLYMVIENAQLSRLGVLTNTFPDFLGDFSLDTILGMGNDPHIVYTKINSYPNKVFLLYYNNDYDSLNGFDDVYWVALLVYHGVAGLALILFLGRMIYKSLMKVNYIGLFNFKLFIKTIFIVIAVLGFFNQILTVRTFSIIFWLLIAYIYNCNKTSDVKLESISR